MPSGRAALSARSVLSFRYFGQVLSLTLLAELPELGRLSRREISLLGDLARSISTLAVSPSLPARPH